VAYQRAQIVQYRVMQIADSGRLRSSGTGQTHTIPVCGLCVRRYLEIGDGRTTAAGVASTRAVAALAVYPVLCHTLGVPGRESRAGTR
jgi:hypothetical protein